MTERGALVLALALNLAMAAAEVVAAIVTRSVALMADAVDFVEDSAIYALALAMRASSETAERRMGHVVAALMMLPGLGVLWQLWRGAGTVPAGGTIFAVSALALAANLASAAAILSARRGAGGGSLGLRAAWLSSRNDALANIAMMGAGVAVTATGARWPDVVVGLGVAALHLSGGIAILRAARAP